MTPSAVGLSDGFDIDTLDIAGALSDDAITAADLLAGRWDGAAVRLFAVDWEQPGAEAVCRWRAARSARSRAATAGSPAELRGPTAVLAAPVVEQNLARMPGEPGRPPLPHRSGAAHANGAGDRYHR